MTTGFRVYNLRLIRPVQTRFRFGSAPETLSLAADHNSPVHYAKGTPSLVAPEGAIELRLLVGAWFQVLLTPLKGVLFIVRSPYWFTIGRDVVLSLGEWTPRFHTVFHGIRATLVGRSTESLRRRVRGFHPLRPAFPYRSADASLCNSSRPPQPRPEGRFGLVRFRSPLLTESRLISFPVGT